MRYTIFAAILALTLSANSANATGGSPKPGFITTGNPSAPHFITTDVPSIPRFKGMEHFLEKFPQATDVNCKTKGQFTEVNFVWNGLRLQAFYNAAGDPVATSRFISVENLPVPALMNLKKDYSSYVVTEAVEFDGIEDGLCYYITVRGPKNTYLLHVSTSGTISVFKKMKQ
ncbi:hypothetical protein ACQ86N_09245 [Puia sp. P3]|uniref:hypothetical protein n=1 Tax=Puia sp. P3 TaxID=3423952 RepID=UPI003D66E1C9